MRDQKQPYDSRSNRMTANGRSMRSISTCWRDIVQGEMPNDKGLGKDKGTKF